ncbi:MAG: hypothetical protein M1828_004253 [Chrysothrix sp. TS-e1954]|nr:MAG: hypothetical protein M1828_004253 [Chrysothrix sp. TS-e1954]
MLPPTEPPKRWPHIPVEATECALYYCVKRYNSSVQNGTLHEIETSAPNASRVSDSWQSPPSWKYAEDVKINETLQKSLIFNNVTSILPRSDLMLGDHFNISCIGVDGISSYFQSQFSRDSDYNIKREFVGDQHRPPAFAANFTLNGYCISNGPIQYDPPVVQAFYQSPDLTDTFRALAKSMSNAMRVNSDGPLLADGIGQNIATCYRIQWPWIVLHGALTLAGMVFFVITIMKTRTRNVPVLKSNSLAPLSRTEELGSSLTGLESVDAIDKEAARRRVQLFKDEQPQRVDGEAIELIRTHPR